MTRLRQQPEPAGAGYAYLEHTADIRLRCWGESFPELVRQALLGTAALLVAPRPAGASLRLIVEIRAPDEVGAVVQAVNELLYLFDVDGLVLADAWVEELPLELGAGRGCAVRLTLSGDDIRTGGPYAVVCGVKAATYHGAEITRTAGGRRTLELTLDL